MTKQRCPYCKRSDQYWLMWSPHAWRAYRDESGCRVCVPTKWVAEFGMHDDNQTEFAECMSCHEVVSV